MGVSAGLIPVTGQPLPWISWGGTSQIFTAIIFGFLLSVSAENKSELLKQDEKMDYKEEEYSDDDIILNIEKGGRTAIGSSLAGGAQEGIFFLHSPLRKGLSGVFPMLRFSLWEP